MIASHSVAERPEPFQIKGTTFKMMVLKIVDPTDPDLFRKLADIIRQAPSFFGRAPIVLDFGDLPAELLISESLVQRMRGIGLMPVGVQGTAPELQTAAESLGLAMMPSGREKKLEIVSPSSDRNEPVKEEKEEPATRATMLITEPVRSGRQIYAAKSDLVVLAPVSAGSEILADGHIHCYDTLRGRALAGLSGDRSSRIFCRKLEAELVSIAGLYKVSEDIDRGFWKANVQIYLQGEKLCVSKLN